MQSSREGFSVSIIRNILTFSNKDGGDLGSIFLGEKLEASLELVNEIQELLSLQMIKLDIQTSSSRTVIFQHSLEGNTGILTRNQEYNHPFIYEIRELGVHVISCSVQFNRPGQLNTTLNYFFKFQSLNPLILKTKIHEKISLTSLLLEAQLHNASNVSLNIQSLMMECVNEDLSVNIINGIASKIEEDNIASYDFNGALLLDGDSTFQFVFHLENKGEKPLIIHNVNLGIPLGRLEIKWSRMEECINQVQMGRLQTGVLYKKDQSLILYEPLIVYEIFPQERERMTFGFYNNIADQTIRNIKFYSLDPSDEEQVQIDELTPNTRILRSINKTLFSSKEEKEREKEREKEKLPSLKSKRFDLEYTIGNSNRKSFIEFNFTM